LHHNAFGGRASPGPTGGARSQTPSWILWVGGRERREREGEGKEREERKERGGKEGTGKGKGMSRDGPPPIKKLVTGLKL